MALSRDGSHLACSLPGSIRIWNLNRPVPPFDLPTRLPTTAICFGSTAQTLFGATEGDRADASQRTQGWIFRWDKIDDQWQQTWCHVLEGGGQSLAISDDAQWLATVNVYASASILDSKLGLTRRILQEFGNSMNDCAISPDGSFLLTAGQSFRIWDLKKLGLQTDETEDISSFDEVRFKKREAEVLIARHTTQAPLVAIAADGRLAASVGGFKSIGTSGELALISVTDPGRFRVLASDSEGHRQASQLPEIKNCMTLTFAPDQELVYAGFQEGKVVRWDCNSGREELVITTGKADLLAMAIMPDGKRIWILHRGSLPECWNLQTGQRTQSLSTQ
jgi:WD40 repeat protein